MTHQQYTAISEILVAHGMRLLLGRKEPLRSLINALPLQRRTPQSAP